MELRRAEVLDRERFGNHVRLRYRWEGLDPEAGRFIMARAGDPSIVPGHFLPRPFFIHDYEGGMASLLFEIRGAGTALLAQQASPLFLSEPLGRGFDLASLADGPVALVGGGVWVAPLKLLARRLAQRGVPFDAYLEVPATAPRAYATLLAETYPTATLVPTDGAAGSPRRILGQLGDAARYRAVYASGPSELLAAVGQACGGRVPSQLAVRERMACGDGSCFGCAVPLAGGSYARACVEGPIFAAEELAQPAVGATSGGARR